MNNPKSYAPRTLAAAACLAAVAFPSFSSAQELVYRETFGTTTRATYASMGWSFRYNNATGTARDGSTATTATAVSEGAHSPLSVGTNVGQTQTSNSATNGLAFFNTTGGFNYFGYTSEYDGTNGPLTTSNIHSITYLNQSETEWQMRAAIQVNDSWYVTDAQAGYTVSGTFDQGAALLTFDLTSTSWTALSFVAGSVLELGATNQVLPTGTITAFGFFGTGGTSSNRIDDFSVYVIPEPSTFAAFAGLGALGVAATRRRRK